MQRRGFILIIVIGLLGVLMFLGIGLADRGRESRQLADIGIEMARARLEARSGIEWARSDILEDIGSASVGSRSTVVTETTLVRGYSASYRDANGGICLNDGLRAGALEAGFDGAFVYDSKQIDPWPVGVENRSGLVNLRLRRLLNAYGDAHRYVDSVYAGQTDLSGTGSPYFVFSGTAANERGISMPGLDGPSNELQTATEIVERSTGLGDRLIAARPQSGYRAPREVRSIVNAWAAAQLSSGYRGEDFFKQIEADLAVGAWEDESFFRMRNEYGSMLSGYVTSTRFDPVYLDKDPPDFRDMWRPHPVTPVNLNAASFLVRAAVFYAPANVTYLAEGNQTYTGFPSLAFPPNGRNQSHTKMCRPSIGVAGPVFHKSRLTENGLVDESVGSHPEPHRIQANRLMSMRDALRLALAYGEFSGAGGTGVLRDFPEFRSFLKWHHETWLPARSWELERANPPHEPYNSFFTNDAFFHPIGPGGAAPPYAGCFTPDYLEATLPELFGCVRRLPGYLGAPQALLSPYATLDSVDIKYNIVTDKYERDVIGSWLMRYQRNNGFYPDRKVEDFVWRFPHPKVTFKVQGRFQIVSEGISGRPGSEAVSNVVTTLEVFRSRTLRTQADLLTAKEGNTSAPSIRIGPEPGEGAVGSPLPSNWLGVIGLRDTPGDGLTTAVVALDFDGDLKPVMSVSRATYDPAAENTTSPHIAQTGGYFDHMNNATLEDGTVSFFEYGARGSDLSPFNGVRFLSLEHSPFTTEGGVSRMFADSLYWRLDDPANTMINPGLPPGHSLNKGHASFWFRIPTGRSRVCRTKYTAGGASHDDFKPRSIYRALMQLDGWAEVPSSTTASLIRPMQVSIGYVEDHHNRKRYVVARMSCHVKKGSEPGNANIYPPVALRPLPTTFDNAVTYQDDFMLPPLMPNFAFVADMPVPYYTWTRKEGQDRAVETIIELQDLPEAGPGTWHHVQVGWNSAYDMTKFGGAYRNDDASDSVDPDPSDSRAVDALWARLSNESVVKQYRRTYRRWDGTNTGLNVTDREDFTDRFRTMNSLNTLSFGEAHTRLMTSFDPERAAPSSTTPGLSDMPDDFSQIAPLTYIPGWRLDSCLDNIRVYLGELPGNRRGWTAPEYDNDHSFKVRYDVTGEPKLRLKTGLAAGVRLLRVGARAYHPKDSNGNFPAVDLSVFESGITGQQKLTDSEELELDPGITVSDQTRVILRYRNERPDGLPLQSDSRFTWASGVTGDDWTAIPWIQEVSWSWAEGEPRFITWSEN